MPNVGDKLNLSLLLWDKDPNSFVRATIYRPDGSKTAFNIPHWDSGLYNEQAISYPSEPFIDIVLDVFKDAAFTRPNLKHPFPECQRLELSKNIVSTSSLFLSCPVTATVKETELITAAVSEGVALVEVADSKATIIVDEGSIFTEVIDGKIVTTIKCRG